MRIPICWLASENGNSNMETCACYFVDNVKRFDKELHTYRVFTLQTSKSLKLRGPRNEIILKFAHLLGAKLQLKSKVKARNLETSLPNTLSYKVAPRNRGRFS